MQAFTPAGTRSLKTDDRRYDWAYVVLLN